MLSRSRGGRVALSRNIMDLVQYRADIMRWDYWRGAGLARRLTAVTDANSLKS